MYGKIKGMELFKTPIAHRGLWNENVPENSMGAFGLAINAGYPIETDIQLSSDDEVIVFHDGTLDRMTVKKGCVIERPYNELKETKLGNSDFGIPLFSEFLKFVNGRVPLLIEFKNTVRNGLLCEKALKLLNSYKGEFAVQSFNPNIVKFFRVNAPEIARGQLATFDYGKGTSRLNAFLLKRLALNSLARPDFISYNAENLPNPYTDRCREKGAGLLAWTVRSQSEYGRLKPYVDNIIFEKFIPEK